MSDRRLVSLRSVVEETNSCRTRNHSVIVKIVTLLITNAILLLCIIISIIIIFINIRSGEVQIFKRYYFLHFLHFIKFYFVKMSWRLLWYCVQAQEFNYTCYTPHKYITISFFLSTFVSSLKPLTSSHMQITNLHTCSVKPE